MFRDATADRFRGTLLLVQAEAIDLQVLHRPPVHAPQAGQVIVQVRGLQADVAASWDRTRRGVPECDLSPVHSVQHFLEFYSLLVIENQ